MTFLANFTPSLWFKRGLYFERKLNWLGAIDAYQQAIRLDPKHSSSHYNLGIIFGLKGHNQISIQHFLLAASDESISSITFNALYNAANIYSKIGNYQQACALYTKLIKQNKNYASAVFNLAQCYKQMNRFEDAAATWKDYLKIDANSEWSKVARLNLSWLKNQKLAIV